ncbi:MAG: hypothetical protein ACRC47_08475 [Shewanella sp.]
MRHFRVTFSGLASVSAAGVHVAGALLAFKALNALIANIGGCGGLRLYSGLTVGEPLTFDVS